MEEADKLADNIVVIDHGKVIAEGTADQLKTKLGGERVEIVLQRRSDMRRAHQVLDLLAVGEVQMDHQNRRLTAAVGDGAESLRKALLQLRRAEVALLDVGLRRPTLDDVFLTLTGHASTNGNGSKTNGATTRTKELTR
jgi:ABC-2 type transport system ATP-binding protein